MTNVKILKDSDSPQVGVYFPQISAEAMISVLKNVGIEPPLANGDLDWSRLKIDGTFKLND